MALDKGKFKPPPPKTTPVEKNASKFCEFHGKVGHTTDECMHLKRQIEEMLKAGKLSHLIKELKQSNRKDQAKAAKKRKPQERKNREEDGTEGHMIMEAEMGEHFVHCMYVDGGFSSEIVYEHCFNRFRPKVKSQMIPSATPLVGFSGEIIWPLGQISPLVKICDEENSTSAWMNFMIDHSIRMRDGLRARSAVAQVGRKELCGLLRRNLDIFAWKPANMTGVTRHIAEHRLNIHEGCLTVRQKKNGKAPKRNKAIYEEVEKLVDAGIMEEVHYHSWLSNLVMKKMRKRQHSSQDKDIFCYSKMSFGLKNARATYQRLVDKAFQKQISQNLEGYVDYLIIKSRTEQEVIRDIEETFKTLKEINMKLNPKKCTFRMREGMFLGYKVNADGLKVCPDMIEAVLSLPSPKCLKDMQMRNGKLASLNRFLSKSAKKSLPFFKTLKKCTKKSDFQWTAKAEKAFKQMKTLIAELPMLTAPKEKEELVIYLAAAKEAISVVLMTERDKKQMPIYFVSHALQGPKINYTLMEKLTLALMQSNPEVAGRLLKWIFELEKHDIHYRPRTSVKGQILSDFIMKRPEDDPPDRPMEDKEELPDPWILFTDGSLCIDGFGASLIITSPEGMEFMYSLSTFKEFSIKQVPRGENKKADALSKLASTSFAHLRKQVLAEELKEKSIDEREVLAVVEEEGRTWMTPIYEYLTEEIPSEEKRMARAIHRKAGRYAVTNGVLYKSMYTGPRSVVHRLVPKNPQQKLTPITSPWPFYKWGIDIARPFSEGPVILVEIGMPTLRTAKVDMIKNDEALEINLDLLEEKREQATIQEAKSKAMMEKYYNARVRNTSFKPGDLVYRSNEASHAKKGGKLGPKWE
nr:reverse transcriptase domain-containing protein [Tanacetum cinerariifolium]